MTTSANSSQSPPATPRRKPLLGGKMSPADIKKQNDYWQAYRNASPAQKKIIEASWKKSGGDSASASKSPTSTSRRRPLLGGKLSPAAIQKQADYWKEYRKASPAVKKRMEASWKKDKKGGGSASDSPRRPGSKRPGMN